MESSQKIIKHSQLEWDLHFLRIAKLCSQMSKDPSTKVGAVIVSNKKIISTGYNGFPVDVTDYEEYYQNRQLKYKYIIHAEKNAILNSPIHIPENSTVYIYPLRPCKECYKLLLNNGVKRVVSVIHKRKYVNPGFYDINDELGCDVCRRVVCTEDRWSFDHLKDPLIKIDLVNNELL